MQPQQPGYGPAANPEPVPSPVNPQPVPPVVPPVMPGPEPTAPVLVPPAGQPGADPYGFITSPAGAPRRNLLAGKSLVVKVLLGVVAIILVLVIVVGIKNIFSTSELNSASLLNVAEDQTELMHLSSGGTNDAVAQTTKNFAYTAQLSVTSQQTQLLSYLKEHGIKGNSKQLALKQSPGIDAELKAANAASTFDGPFISVMQAQLATYQKDLKQAYTLNPGVKARALLTTDYDGATLLLKQLSAPAS